MSSRIGTATIVALMLSLVPPVVIVDSTIAQIPASTSAVLTSVNGQNLTQSMVDNFIAYGEFLADHKFTAVDKRWLTGVFVKDFRNDPAVVMQGYKDVREALQLIKQFRSPVELVKARELLMIDTYLKLLGNQGLEKPSLWTVVYRYSPILVADPGAKVVVTERAVGYYLAALNFIESLVGQSVTTPEGKAQLRQWLQQNFHSLPLESKKTFATAESTWLQVQAAWSNFSPQERQQVIAAIKQQRPEQVAPAALRVENNGSSAMDKLDRSIERAADLLIRINTILPAF